MNKKSCLDKILQKRILAIIRLKEVAIAPELVECIISGGVEILEFTSNTPSFLNEIESTRKRYPNVLVGAGTILNEKLAKNAIGAGAQFLVTPNVNEKVAIIAQKFNVPIIMGAFTPTEVANAMVSGADIIKLFPAQLLGIRYLKALMEPFNKAKFFAVGGINHENVKDWFAAGVHGVGIGGGVTGKGTKNSFDLEKVRKNARLIMSINKGLE